MARKDHEIAVFWFVVVMGVGLASWFAIVAFLLWALEGVYAYTG